ncbi:uncharacterized protein LOC113142140 [Mastacembelus armatus]|uniref:Uncharacterized LOC113142140 n=1 Tax=Mastacembelus armatus TaxID=205130 RepID=A0A3Q3M457_9TELE|nr:uncharacterized protein LOC113142140 [Mastacembelus armatus]
MGNLPLSTSLFRNEAAMSEQISGGKFTARRISNSITYYCASVPGAGNQTLLSAKDSQSSILPLSPSALPLSDSSSADASLAPLLSHSPTSMTSQSQSQFASTSRPLLLFFSWLCAQPGGVAKYRDLYLDCGMDVLLVQSSVMHFLWPRWGLNYGLELLKVLEDPQFSERVVLVHASSIGGYTFTQILTHISQEPKKHEGVARRVIGHIYDSLVVGSLEHMAIGLGKTLLPRLEGFIKNAAMFYFWLFKAYTADMYESSIQVFNNSPITAPALFFFSENDALCNSVVMENMMDLWRRRGVAVESKKWKESIHAAHMRCHPEEYLCTLDKFLKSLHISSFKAKM